MGTMDEVLERLDETEKQAGEVLRQLEEAESLHKSLAETRQGLDAIVRDVKELVTATRKGIETLGEAVTAFKTATETIQRSDPGVITAALKTIETRIDAIGGEVSAIAQIKEEVTGLKAAVARTASVNEERTRTMIDNAIEELSAQSLMDRVLGQRRRGNALSGVTTSPEAPGPDLGDPVDGRGRTGSSDR